MYYEFPSGYDVRDIQTISDFDVAAEASQPESSPVQLLCQDDFRSLMYPHLSHATWEAIRDKVGNNSVSSCDDVIAFCDVTDNAGKLVRLHCPRACGAQHNRPTPIPAHGAGAPTRAPQCFNFAPL